MTLLSNCGMAVSPFTAGRCTSRLMQFQGVPLRCKDASLARGQKTHRRLTPVYRIHVTNTSSQSLCRICDAKPSHLQDGQSAQGISRRSVAAAMLAVVTFLDPVRALADGLVAFTSSKQGYRVERPAGWDQSSKAGADVLFTDPAKKSTTVGVTVSPIRISSLEQFGDIQLVRTKLINTEKDKESTKAVDLISESSRKGKSGVLIYDIEYELDSTRGRKRILSTVAIAQKKLFIVNGNLKCDASGCSKADEKGIALLRDVAQTFDIL